MRVSQDSTYDLIPDYSERTPLSLTDLYAIKILLCYLLSKLERPVTPEQLYEIAVGSGILNYFYYTEAMDELLKSHVIELRRNEKHTQDFYYLTQQGKYGGEEFKRHVPLSLREQILACALKYFARLKRENEVKCEYISTDKGCYVYCRILDVQDDLLNLKIFAPDEEQARLIGKRIMSNPTDFYGRIMGYALDLTEEEPVIED